MAEVTERDRRILFLEAQRAENDAGEEAIIGWNKLFYRWAAYEPVSDGERLRAAAVEQRSDARFRVLWSGPMVQITGAHRLRFDGADWQITGLKERGFKGEIEITAWKIAEVS
ncbi:phage head completion protein [Tritonibacter scottomollicae]|uniref:phage head completion protein n=1 Tax=Tritonibacter scottomollicae TaxID=483013 RepID=UPI003BA93DA2